MELSEELIAKAKGTKTPEELAALAKESSIDLTEEEAKAYFEQLHPKLHPLLQRRRQRAAHERVEHGRGGPASRPGP